MNLFDKLVDEALQKSNTANIRPVIEKELLHHDILREMSKAGFLKNLTFMGGTCLRACYGAQRLSEDLDFTGGANFKKTHLIEFSQTIADRLYEKYELDVSVSKPSREVGNTTTWKIKVVTQPKRKNLPLQRINIDICAIPSHQRTPMTIINHYDIEMGTGGLIIQSESREEILLDKIIAFALRPNRIKNRDLWDIAWLKQQNIKLPSTLIKSKIKDHCCAKQKLIDNLAHRCQELENDSTLKKSFNHEMMRFLPYDIAQKTLTQSEFWTYIIAQTIDESYKVINHLKGITTHSSSNEFPMS